MSSSNSNGPLENSKYSLIYLIHGDANYIYHENGKRYQADEQALEDALAIAKKARSGEVFILHQKPERKILGLFPKKDRVFYHFVNGALQNKMNYSPEDGGFTKEAQIYNELSAAETNRNFFFYFGHEIPTFTEQHYHTSQPDQKLNTAIFSDHLSAFSPFFDLTVVSTCNNGNPKFVHALSDNTEFLIASPQNLHLSYFTLKKISLLEENPEIETEALADSIAQDSFTELSANLQTMITVGVYDLSLIESYSATLADRYSIYLEDISAKPLFTDNIDCVNLPFLRNSLDTNGISLYYKPPAFGRKASQKTHSGWGCKE